MKQSKIIRDALRKRYKAPKETSGSCQHFLKKLAEDLAKEGK